MMEKKRNWSYLKQERFDLTELPLADSVRTFDGMTYQLTLANCNRTRE
ncbi:hypothetical protein [Exiguobacterium sp. JMULE1]|nr:hypothetical protein [Exiguobacterium sp. JMULE1]